MSTMTFSERDRRWNLVRGEMKKRGLSCLVVAAGAEYAEWLSDDTPWEKFGYIIFPLDGEPTILINVYQFQFSIKKGMWVSDYRYAPIFGEGIAARIQEMGLENSKIGTIGVDPGGMHWSDGGIPYRTWSTILKVLPKASFEDATWWMVELMLPKSEEEMRFVEKGHVWR